MKKMNVQTMTIERRLGFITVFIDKKKKARWARVTNVLNGSWPKKPVLTPERNLLNPYIQIGILKYSERDGKSFSSKFDRMKKLC